jgi:hypothetical protein
VACTGNVATAEAAGGGTARIDTRTGAGGAAGADAERGASATASAHA